MTHQHDAQSQSYPYRAYLGRRITSTSSTSGLLRLATASTRQSAWHDTPALVISDGKGQEIELYLTVLDVCLDALADGSAEAPLGEQDVGRLLRRSDLPKVPNISRSDTYYGAIASGLFELGITRQAPS